MDKDKDPKTVGLLPYQTLSKEELKRRGAIAKAKFKETEASQKVPLETRLKEFTI